MVVRIIYRPSHLGATFTRRSSDGNVPSFEPGTGVCESEPAARPGSHSQRVMMRSLALLLVRLGFVSMIVAAWRIATDLGLPVPFVIKVGMLSHWQVWFAAGVLLMICAGLVARRLQFGKAQDERNDGRAQAA